MECLFYTWIYQAEATSGSLVAGARASWVLDFFISSLRSIMQAKSILTDESTHETGYARNSVCRSGLKRKAV